MSNDGIPERGGDGDKSKKRVRQLSDKSKTTMITTIVTVVGSVLVAVLTTMGTIANSKTQLKETKEGIDTARTDINALQDQVKAQTDALLANARKQFEETGKKLEEDQKQLEEMLKTTKQLNETIANALLPAGTIVAFAGPIDREKIEGAGWLICDGTPISRTKYSRLHGMIGDSWGKGDGVNTFNLPDLRGVFLRGVNQGRADAFADPEVGRRRSLTTGGNAGNNVGSFQDDALQNVAGTIGDFNNFGAFKGTPTGPFAKTTSGYKSQGIPGGHTDPYDRITMDLSRAPAARTSTETRPRNAYVHYIIKY